MSFDVRYAPVSDAMLWYSHVPASKEIEMGDGAFMHGRHRSRMIWHRQHLLKGHKSTSIEAGLFVGEVVFANGERGTYLGSETVGTFDDPGIFSGNAIVVLEDGSVSNQTSEGTTDATTDPRRLNGTGIWKMESGTGRFAGVSGSGPFRWSMTGDEYEDEF
jgi:hypothetical protein